MEAYPVVELRFPREAGAPAGAPAGGANPAAPWGARGRAAGAGGAVLALLPPAGARPLGLPVEALPGGGFEVEGAFCSSACAAMFNARSGELPQVVLERHALLVACAAQRGEEVRFAPPRKRCAPSAADDAGGSRGRGGGGAHLLHGAGADRAHRAQGLQGERGGTPSASCRCRARSARRGAPAAARASAAARGATAARVAAPGSLEASMDLRVSPRA